MTKLRELASRIRGFFSKDSLDRDLDDELRAHLEMLVEENVSRGMTIEEARNAARRSFGGLEQTKEAYRHQRGLPVVDSLSRDFRYGLRMLRRYPGFTVVAVVTLALGIGANTAIFSVVNAALLHPFGYLEPDKLVLLAEKRREMNLIALSYPDFVDWKTQNQVFDSMGAVRRWNPNLTGAGEPERLQAAMVTVGIFPTLGIAPHIGRVFDETEDRPGGERVAVLSYNFWLRRFGGVPGVLGEYLTLDQQSYTIVGVMPPRFEFWTADVWVPIGLIADEINRRDVHPGIYGIGRLKPGSSLADVRTDLGAIAAKLEEAYPTTNVQIGADPVLWSHQVGNDLRPALFVLFGAVMFVLLIAAANMAGLQLGRVTGRQRELAIRAALGATRWALLRQLLVENILLALLGGTVGLLVVAWSLNSLVALIPPNSFTAEVRFSVDARVLSFTAIVSLATGLVFGLVPAWQASRSSVSDLLKGSPSRPKRFRYSPRVRDLLITLEIAVALVLVTGAALLIKSFAQLRNLESGFDPHGVLALTINLPERTRDARKHADYLQSIVARVRETPGVESAAATTALPFTSMPRTGPTTLLDRSLPERIEDVPVFRSGMVSPGFFETLRIPLIRGRMLDDRDGPQNPWVCVINETAAKRFWEDSDPIGRTLALGPPEHMVEGAIPSGYRFPRLQIVGVIGDVKFDSLDSNIAPQLFLSFIQSAAANGPMVWGATRIVVRCERDPATMISSLRTAVWTVNKDQPVSSVSTIDELYSRSVDQPRMASRLMALMAALAMVLAGVGIFGVISYSVGERKREIGIRIALGADSRAILRTVVGRVLGWVLTGIVIGIGAALAFTRVLESLLYGMPARDPVVIAGVSLALLSTALLASWLPAQRATRIDPMTTLRCD